MRTQVEDQNFDPSRWAVHDVYFDGRFRGWQVMRDGQPISGLFDERRWADLAMTEFRDEAKAQAFSGQEKPA